MATRAGGVLEMVSGSIMASSGPRGMTGAGRFAALPCKLLLQLLDLGGQLLHGVDQHVGQRRRVEDAHVVELRLAADADALDRLRNDRLDFLAEHTDAGLTRGCPRAAVVAEADRSHLPQRRQPQLQIAHVVLYASI